MEQQTRLISHTESETIKNKQRLKYANYCVKNLKKSSTKIKPGNIKQ